MAPSRRNGNTDAGRGHGVTKSHQNKGDSSDSGFTSTNGGLKGAAFGDTKLNRPRASAFMETNLQTLRGEVRGIKSPQSTCRKLPNDTVEESAKVNVSRGNGPSALPRVDASDSLSNTLGNNNRLAGTRNIKDLRKDHGLPNIFSNVGKSFVETNQLAVFDRASFRKKPTCVKAAVIPVEKPAMEASGDQQNEPQCQKESPKAKGRKKKKRKAKGCSERRAGKDEFGNEQRDGLNECDTETSCRVKQQRKLTEKTADIEGSMENGAKRQRPGTALGRWFKRHDNTVAPAPLCDSTRCSPKAEKESMPNEERLREDSPDKHDFCPSLSPHATTVFVSECHENISVLMPKEIPHEKPELKFRELGATNVESSLKTADDEQTNLAKEGKEEKPIDEKVTPACPFKVRGRKSLPKEENRGSNMERKKKKAPYPVKRDLVKETLENIPSAVLNDKPKQKPKVVMKKELKGQKLNRTDAQIKTQQDEENALSISLNKGSVWSRENLLLKSSLDTCGGLSKASALDETSTLTHYKTVNVKQRADKTLENMPADSSSTVDSSSGALNTKNADVKSSTRYSFNLGARQLPLLDDSDFQDCATFEIKDGVVSSIPTNAATSSATAGPMFPAIGRNKATRKMTSIPTSNQLVTSERYSSSSQRANEKPTWNSGKLCLPAIQSDKKQMAATFLDKRQRKVKQEMDVAFQRWGQVEEQDEVTRILERPLTAKLPNYPAHWAPLPDRRPPGRGGQGYCLGVNWKKPDKSLLSESSREGTSGE